MKPHNWWKSVAIPQSQGSDVISARRLERRAFIEGTAFLAAVTLTGTLAGRVRAQDKMSQEQAQYQDSPNNGQKCAGCKFYVQTQGACRRVEGSIKPNGWCSLWTATA